MTVTVTRSAAGLRQRPNESPAVPRTQARKHSESRTSCQCQSRWQQSRCQWPVTTVTGNSSRWWSRLRVDDHARRWIWASAIGSGKRSVRGSCKLQVAKSALASDCENRILNAFFFAPVVQSRSCRQRDLTLKRRSPVVQTALALTAAVAPGTSAALGHEGGAHTATTSSPTPRRSP